MEETWWWMIGGWKQKEHPVQANGILCKEDRNKMNLWESHFWRIW